jgi:hypothetical protein
MYSDVSGSKNLIAAMSRNYSAGDPLAAVAEVRRIIEAGPRVI